VIETERLLLRDWRAEDAEPFAALNADPEVARYLSGPMSRAQSDELIARIRAHWDEHGFGLYAVEAKASGAFAGFIGLAIPSFLPAVLPAVEMGWRLAREQWGNGYATEGGRASLAHGFGELGLKQIIAIIDPRNVASIRVAQRLGMVRGRDRIHPHTRARVAVYAKNAEDAASSRRAS
jgi:RimJ/RimL family protein N-acetyltransferase